MLLKTALPWVALTAFPAAPVLALAAGSPLPLLVPLVLCFPAAAVAPRGR